MELDKYFKIRRKKCDEARIHFWECTVIGNWDILKLSAPVKLFLGKRRYTTQCTFIGME